MGRGRSSLHQPLAVADRIETRFGAVFGPGRSSRTAPPSAEALALLQPPVAAEAHTDDHEFEVSFDAASWFAQAADHEIVGLADCGWGGNYEADVVASFYDDAETEQMFAYLHREHKLDRDLAPGFECHVDEAAARTWVAAHRPHLLAEI